MTCLHYGYVPWIRQLSRRIGKIMKALAVFVFIVGMTTISCATTHSEEMATLRIECNVSDAAVLLDDDLLGRAGELKKVDKSVRPGFYRVEIRHPGYYSYFTEITVPEGGAAAVKADLHPLLD
jgi:hypothetical protein